MCTINDKSEKAKRFAKVLLTTRYKSKLSQERMAAELCVSKRTVQNWENGISVPDFLQCVQWFEIAGVNPLATMCEYFHSTKERLAGSSDDQEISNLFDAVASSLPTDYKRSLLFVLSGEHGSSVYALLQLLVAHLHSPMKDRVPTAIMVAQMYALEKKLGNLVCNDGVMPDEEVLSSAIQKAIRAVETGKCGYVNDLD